MLLRRLACREILSARWLWLAKDARIACVTAAMPWCQDPVYLLALVAPLPPSCRCDMGFHGTRRSRTAAAIMCRFSSMRMQTGVVYWFEPRTCKTSPPCPATLPIKQPAQHVSLHMHAPTACMPAHACARVTWSAACMHASCHQHAARCPDSCPPAPGSILQCRPAAHRHVRQRRAAARGRLHGKQRHLQHHRGRFHHPFVVP